MGNTPFRRWKRATYRGGVSDPFIVCWPKGIKTRGEIRTQYAHAIDMLPTVLDALGIEAPTVIRGVMPSPIEGVSLTDSFNNTNAPSKHITQYFEMMGLHGKFSGEVNWVQIDMGKDAEDVGHLISPAERLQVAMALH